MDISITIPGDGWRRPVPEPLMRELLSQRLKSWPVVWIEQMPPASVRYLFFWLFVIERNTYRLN